MAVSLQENNQWTDNGSTFTWVAGTLAAGSSPDNFTNRGWSLTGNKTGIWSGRMLFDSNLDFSGERFVTFRLFFAEFAMGANIDTLVNGGVRILFFDGSGNWSEFYVHGTIPDQGIAGTWGSNKTGDERGIFTIDMSRTPDNSSGTLDWSDIDGLELTVKSASADEFEMFIDDIQTSDGSLLTGTVSFQDLKDEVDAAPTNTLQHDRRFNNINLNYVGASGTVWNPWFPMDIGDGSTATTLNESAFELAFYPDAYSTDCEVPLLFLDDNYTRWITINQSASDNIDLANGTISSSKSPDYQWGLKVEGSSSGACDFSIMRFLRAKEIRLAHATADGCTFDDCEDVKITSSTTLTDAIFRNLSATSKGLHIISGAGNYSGVTATFAASNSGDDITLGAGGAGTYVLTGISTSGGHTINIHNDSATNAVTVEIPAGVLYTTSTAGGSITVSAPSTTYTLQLPNIIDGSRYQIYNVTQDTELTNDTVTGGGGIDETYTLSTDYNASDVGRIRVTYVSGTSAKQEYSTTFTFGATTTTNSIPATQVDDAVYNANAIDGSGITKFAADYTDTEIDVIVTSNFSGAELYAWYTYNNTTSNGIANFFGIVRAIDAANFEIDQTVADVYFDITTSANVYQTDNIRIFRKDGAYPVKDPTTGGGAIDLVWREKVLIAETGVSGLTAAESTQLAAIATIQAAIAALNDLSAAEVNAEVDAALADAGLDTISAELAVVDANVDTIQTVTDEIHKLQGLDAANPMTVTPTSRVAGGISQTISGDGTTTSTVTRV